MKFVEWPQTGRIKTEWGNLFKILKFSNFVQKGGFQKIKTSITFFVCLTLIHTQIANTLQFPQQQSPIPGAFLFPAKTKNYWVLAAICLKKEVGMVNFGWHRLWMVSYIWNVNNVKTNRYNFFCFFIVKNHVTLQVIIDENMKIIFCQQRNNRTTNQYEHLY